MTISKIVSVTIICGSDTNSPRLSDMPIAVKKIRSSKPSKGAMSASSSWR